MYFSKNAKRIIFWSDRLCPLVIVVVDILDNQFLLGIWLLVWKKLAYIVNQEKGYRGAVV